MIVDTNPVDANVGFFQSLAKDIVRAIRGDDDIERDVKFELDESIADDDSFREVLRNFGDEDDNNSTRELVSSGESVFGKFSTSLKPGLPERFDELSIVDRMALNEFSTTTYNQLLVSTSHNISLNKAEESRVVSENTHNIKMQKIALLESMFAEEDSNLE